MSLQKIRVVLAIIAGAAVLGIALIIINIPASQDVTSPKSGGVLQQPSSSKDTNPLTNTMRDPKTLHVPDTLFGIIGTIQKIEGRALTIEGTILSETPSAEGKDLFSEIKFVTLTDGAKLTKTTFIRKADLASEAPKMIPQQTVIAVEDLRIGMQVQALVGKNIPNERSFNALSLNVL